MPGVFIMANCPPACNSFDSNSVTQDPKTESYQHFEPSKNELPNAVLEEFRKSGIPDDLTLANIEWAEEEELLELLTGEKIGSLGGHATQYATREVQNILKRYESLDGVGAWLAFGTTIDGGLGKVAYIKPKNPRFAPSEGLGKPIKVVKYETPVGCPALPLLPIIPGHYQDLICKRYKVHPLECETVWQMVQRLNLPIFICEGLKKALAAIAQGFVAICLRGISQWSEPREKSSLFYRRKSPRQLQSILKEFATRKRQFFICFDSDIKQSTQENVAREAIALGKALEQWGCKASVCQWESNRGKGIDDLLADLPESEREQALSKILNEAPTLQKFIRPRQVEESLNHLLESNLIQYPIEVITEGQYIPGLPTPNPGDLMVVSATTGVGKTESLIKTVNAHLAKSSTSMAVVILPLNSLGKQTAERLNGVHIHDYGTDTDSQVALEMDLAHRRVIVLCADSLHRLPAWVWQRDFVLILDEVNQVIENLTEGGTLGDARWASHNQLFTDTCRKSESIIGLEANLPNRAAKFLERVSEKSNVRVITHRTTKERGPVTIHQGSPTQASGYLGQAMNRAASGKRILMPVSSKATGLKVQRALAKTQPQLKVECICSDTNEGGRYDGFFRDPDKWLQDNQVDVLIVTPSVKSGVSIDRYYFDEVWAYFPSLGTDTHLQLLGRYRQPVPIHIYCPEVIASKEDDVLAWAGKAKRLKTAEQLARIMSLTDALSPDNVALQDAIDTYLAESRTVRFHQARIAQTYLAELLTQAGHTITYEALVTDRKTSALLKESQNELDHEKAEQLAGMKIDEWHTEGWAHEILSSGESSYTQRLRAFKVLKRVEFPGLDWDDAGECYEALIKDYGRMARGVKYQVMAENLKAAIAQDRAAAVELLRTGLKPYHRLPQNALRAAAIAATGVLDLLGLESFSNDTSQALTVKANALQYRDQIWEFLRLTINPGQTPSEIISKLLRRLGLGLQKVAHLGSRGNRKVFYCISGASELRQRMLSAYQANLTNRVQGISNNALNKNRLHKVNELESINSPPSNIAPIDTGGGGLAAA